MTEVADHGQQVSPFLASRHAAAARLRHAYAAIPPGTPVRLAKSTSNLFRFRDDGGPGLATLDVSAFSGVLHVDPAARTAVVGGMTTYEDLADATLRHGLMPLVVPQLKTITLGGAVSGLGIESSSLRNGLPHESVLEMDILTGDGRVVTAAPDTEHAALYRGFPNSYGTLGYALWLTIELEPVAPYVHLRHFRFASPAEAMTAIARDRPRRQLPGASRRLRRRDRVQPERDLPDRRRLQRGRAVAERLHRTAASTTVHPRTAGGLPDDPRLPVAVGHGLVLVLAAVRRAAAARPAGCGRAGTAAPTSTASWSPSTAGTG